MGRYIQLTSRKGVFKDTKLDKVLDEVLGLDTPNRLSTRVRNYLTVTNTFYYINFPVPEIYELPSK